mmetsp:Transcript_5404/g.15301  ORF Transcript_5404/g.15301 Transcript_5404/m.15301 type:complete len:671 (+) Transcript_5404:70-2082(+)
MTCRYVVALVLALLALSCLLRRQDIVELGQQLAAGEVQWKTSSVASSLSSLTASPWSSSSLKTNLDNSSLAYQAIEFVQSRKTAHHAAGFNYAHWRLRGVGYLLEQHGMVLAAEVPTSSSEVNIVGENTFITIRDVSTYTKDKKKWTAEECSKFFIWVRVRGGEIFAGQAPTADATTITSAGHVCVWRYEFQPSVSGLYHVDAKIIQYNGNQPHTPDMKCVVNNTDTDAGRAGLQNIIDEYPLHAGWKGFKLYYPAVACCEICTRMEGCRAWSSPPFNIAPSQLHTVTNGCELYYDKSTAVEIIPRSHLHGNLSMSLMQELQAPNASLIQKTVNYIFGRPHRQIPAMNFVGCGWSNWFTLDFPCVSGELGDMVFMQNNSFAVLPQRSTDSLQQSPWELESKLPLCELDEELNSSGRWVRGTVPPECQEITFDPKRTKFSIVEWDGAHPHCWHRDDLARVGQGCFEINCRLIDPESKYMSPMRDETPIWYGKWMPRRCRYLELTDVQLQKCIDARQIVSFNREGRSISEFLDEYVTQRIGYVKPFNGTSKGAFAILSTKALLHLMSLSDEELAETLRNLPNVTESRQYFIVGGFFLSSERETYADAERMKTVNDMLKKEITTKGYQYLSAYDLSAAFTYDTAAQFDGMHIIGPPMKALITKYFHFLCKDVI